MSTRLFLLQVKLARLSSSGRGAVLPGGRSCDGDGDCAPLPSLLPLLCVVPWALKHPETLVLLWSTSPGPAVGVGCSRTGIPMLRCWAVVEGPCAQLLLNLTQLIQLC